MKNHILVSIIIPFYNTEKYIHSCLNSVLQQDWPFIEIICINDGSTDKTKDILDNYASKEDRITVYHKINEGAAIARSYGVSKASGDYVMFVDSDDTIISNAVSSMVKIILEDRNVDIVVSGFNIIKNNKVVRKFSTNFTSFNNIEYLRNVLTGRCGMELCAKLFKKNLFDANIVIPDIKIGEDAYVLMQLINNSSLIKFIPFPIYNYIQNLSSATHTKSIKYVEDTLLAGVIIEKYLSNQTYYASIKRYVDCLHLLLYSNSTRRGYVDLKNKYVANIINNHYSVSALRLISLKKALYIFFLLKCNGHKLLKLYHNLF